MSRVAERQSFIRYWQETSGETEIDLHKVAQLALKMGMTAPPPISAEDRLAQQFKEAAKQDIRRDRKTGRPYRGYHANTDREIENVLRSKWTRWARDSYSPDGWTGTAECVEQFVKKFAGLRGYLVSAL